jgi:hypothetical protein
MDAECTHDTHYPSDMSDAEWVLIRPYVDVQHILELHVLFACAASSMRSFIRTRRGVSGRCYHMTIPILRRSTGI